MFRLFKPLILSLILFLSVYLIISAQTIQPILTVAVNDLDYGGLLFLTPGHESCAVTDLSGNVIYEIAPVACFDFKVLENGDWIYYDRDKAIWNQHAPYSDTIKRTYTISGSLTDVHDIIVKDNYVWLMGRKLFTAITGTLAITLFESTIQKQDLSGNVLFDWHSKDHIGLDESTISFRPNGSYPHSNSFYEDTDGNLIVSFRNTNSVVKICVTGDGCQVGEIIWRLGGLKSDFTFVNDRGIAKQHSAVMIDKCQGGIDRCLLLFDNGEDFDPQYSRAVEYIMNESQGVVTKTWEYTAGGQIFARAMGNVARLSNGDTVIGWGAAHGSDPDAPTVTVVDWDGNIKYEAALPEGMSNYRVYLYSEWRLFLPLVVR